MAIKQVNDQDVQDIIVKNHGLKVAVMFYVEKGNQAGNRLTLALASENALEMAKEASIMADALKNIRQVLAPDDAQIGK